MIVLIVILPVWCGQLVFDAVYHDENIIRICYYRIIYLHREQQQLSGTGFRQRNGFCHRLFCGNQQCISVSSHWKFLLYRLQDGFHLLFGYGLRGVGLFRFRVSNLLRQNDS